MIYEIYHNICIYCIVYLDYYIKSAIIKIFYSRNIYIISRRSAIIEPILFCTPGILPRFVCLDECVNKIKHFNFLPKSIRRCSPKSGQTKRETQTRRQCWDFLTGVLCGSQPYFGFVIVFGFFLKRTCTCLLFFFAITMDGCHRYLFITIY